MIHHSEELQRLIQHMQQVIVGKRMVLELLVTALLSEGHVLISSFFGFSLSILIWGVLLFTALVQRSAGLASIAGTVLLLMVGSSLWTRIAPYRLSLLFLSIFWEKPS